MKLKLFKRTPLRLLTGLFLLAATRSFAADTNYDGTLWTLTDAHASLAAAAEITPAKYPDCDAATVEEKLVRVYHADGTAECQDESYEKVLTEKGRRESRMITLGFMLPYSTVKVARLEVIKPDGTVVPVDVAANSKESIDESQMAENIYDPNMKVLQVNLPKVEVGDVVHAVTRETIERARIPGHFAEDNIFEGGELIRHASYEVHAPASTPLQQIALRDPVAGTIQATTATNADGAITYHWEVNNVPRMFDEPAMPPASEVLQRVLVSTLPDWPAVSQWYWDLSKSHLEAVTPAMKTAVATLTNGAATELDRVKALFYDVSQKVRYMGRTAETDRPGFEPHDVCMTFDKKYGVCRDKAALLVSLLRLAGFQAYPVLISIGNKRDVDVPDSFFNHAIVAVELTKGEYTLMDPTDENTRDFLPYSDCNQSYLVCRPEGEKLRLSPVQPPERHMMRVTTTGALAVDGTLTAKSVLLFEGVNDDAYRNAFVQMKPDDKRRFFESNLKQTLPGARLTSLKLLPENMLDMSSSVRAEIDFTATGMTATGNGKSIVNLPWIGEHLGIVNFILGGTGLDKRKYPLQTSATCGLDESVSLTLGTGFGDAISLPTCAPEEDKNLSWQERFTCSGGTLTGARTLKLKTLEFSPEGYAKLKATLKAMEYDGRKSPIIAVTAGSTTPPLASAPAADAPETSDAKILESRKTLTVTDAHTAVYDVKYSKQILTYNGKKREAELKLDYNPATQEAGLISAVVVSKAGKREAVSAGEINVMDAGWNPSAKRYTGGKILVANLPDVDIGSTIEVEFAITNHGRPFLAGYESFQMPDELAAKTVTLTAPDNVAVHQRVSGSDKSLQTSKMTAAGTTTLTWSAHDVKALPAEASTPPQWLWASGVNYFIGNADDYYNELNRTLLDRAARSTNTAAMTQKLVAGKTPREAVLAIRNFVAESIREAGPSFAELPLSELSAADTTLADGYGHMADRAILLHAMLTAAGLRPEFVLGSSLPPIKSIIKVANEFPLPEDFQAPLVRVHVAGETYYLNDTDQYAELGTTAHARQLGLVLASRHQEWIKPVKNHEEHAETAYQISLADNGHVQVGVTTLYFGTSFGSWNRYFTELPPEERRRYYQELVSGFAQGARPVGDLITKFDTYPGRQQYTVEVDNYAVVDGKYCYFDLPFTPSLFPVGADRRILPLYAPEQGTETIHTEINLPPSFRRVVIAPPGEKLQAPGGTARITSANAGGKYEITHQFTTIPTIVAPGDYADRLKAESALRQKSSRVFLLEKE